MANQFLEAEQAGKAAFRSGTIDSYALAERVARKAYPIALQRECFVAGWNQAFWDEQSRVFAATRSEVAP